MSKPTIDELTPTDEQERDAQRFDTKALADALAAYVRNYRRADWNKFVAHHDREEVLIRLNAITEQLIDVFARTLSKSR